MITVLQNFICTKKTRLNLIESELPVMGSVLKDYEFHVNYGTDIFVDEVKSIYKSNIDKLNFYNNLEPDWGAITLAMAQQVTSPYILVLCEDFEYCMDYEYFQGIMNEVTLSNVQYMPLGRLWKYSSRDQYWNNYESGDKLWLYKAIDSPGSSLSVDALYKTEIFVEKLTELQQYASHRFPLNLPHHYENIFHEDNNNGVRKLGKDVICAVPKKEILKHIQEETETILNK